MPAVKTKSDIPVLLGLGEMVDIFPVSKMSVYRWRSPSNPILPEPDLTVSRTPMWRLERVEEFAKQRGLEIDRKKLRQILKAQGH